MSTQPVPTPTSTALPQLSAEYKRIQKVYVLVAAGLMCWRLFGATIDLSKIGITLPGADGGPYVLGIALAYLSYKLIIEWSESDEKCRQKTASRIDFWVTHAIALSSVLVVAQQYLLKFKIGESVSRHSGWLIFLSGLAVLMTFLSFMWYSDAHLSRWMKILGSIPLLAMLATSVGLLVYTARIRGPISALASLVLGIAPILGLLTVAGFFMVLFAIGVASGAAALISGDTEDNPGPSPFDALGQ